MLSNILVPMENLISVVTLIFLDLETEGGILFLGCSKKNKYIYS